MVTRHGRAVAVVLGIEEFRRLHGARPDTKAFLLSGGPVVELDIPREREAPRDLDLSELA